MEHETEIEYSDEDKVYGFHQIRSMFTCTAAPTADASGMLGAYKQKFGGLLQKVNTGMFALCPLPDQYEVNGKTWFLTVSAIVEEVASYGASCISSFGFVHFFFDE